MAMIPGERNDQYRRNFVRATASVAMARVSVRNIDCVAPIGSASKRPRDLHVARLIERGKLVGRKGAEGDVGLPRLRDRAHDHFTAGHFRQHAPTHRCGRCQQTAWPHRGVRFAAEEHLTRLEDGADNRRLQHVHLTRGREGDVRRRLDTNVVTFCDVGDRHEAVEQWIIALDRRAARVPVAPPGNGGVAGIGSSGDSDPQ